MTNYNNTTIVENGTFEVWAENMTHKDNYRSAGESYTLACIVGVFGVLAFLGNVIVIACIRIYRRLRREIGTYFIVNLCVADMLTSAIVMSSSFYCVIAGVATVNVAYCQFVCCMNYTLIIVSMLTLSFIAFDRYLAVVHALRYHVLMKKRVALILISWSWLQGLCFGIVPVIENWIHYDYWEIVCAIKWVGRDPLIYVIVAFSLCFLMPGGTLAIFYCKVMTVVNVQCPRFNLGSLDNEQTNVLGPKNDFPGPTLNGTHNCNSLRNASPEGENDDIKRCYHPADKTRHSFQEFPRENETVQINARGDDFGNESGAATANHYNNLLYTNTTLSPSSSPQTENKNPKSHNQPDNIIFENNKSSRRHHKYDNQNIPTANNVFSSAPDLQALSLPLPPLPPTQSSTSLPRSHSYSKLPTTTTTTYDAVDRNNHSNNHISPESSVHSKDAATMIQQHHQLSVSLDHNQKKDDNKLMKNGEYSASQKALRSFFIIVMAFFVCMTPFSVTKLYKVIQSDTHALPGYVNVVSTLAQYFSSAINPFIYGVLRKDFQTAFKILIHKIKRPASFDANAYTLSQG